MTELLDALPVAPAATSFALGARHGLDRDHIAAITDLTAPRKDDEHAPRRHARRGLGLSFWYCAGHGLVLGRDRGDYRYAGRISLVVGALRRGWARARRREAPTQPNDVDRRGAFTVGLLHGTGAETPTQVVLFASAGASGSAGTAAVVLGAFVVGLVLADLAIAGAWVSGLLGARRTPRVQLGLGVVTGVASFVLGLLVLTGYSGIVPPLVTK
ncbi:MAG: hypothetical protein KY451_11090 [Actinobacteria bacterium]|nr:hypothetical protein [Actinomycetota bacterium]